MSTTMEDVAVGAEAGRRAAWAQFYEMKRRAEAAEAELAALRSLPTADERPEWPEGTAEAAHLLDSLALPITATWREACAALSRAGYGVADDTDVVVKAVKWRRIKADHERVTP